MNHSLYYMNSTDLDTLFKHPSCYEVKAAVHLPHIGHTLPIQTPEYEWVNAADWKAAGIARRWGAKFREALTGTQQVVLAPLKTGTTTYEHSNLTEMVQRGGYHHTKLSAYKDKVGTPLTALKAAIVGGAVSAASAFLTSPGPIPVKTAQAVVAGVSAAVGTTLFIRALHNIEKWETPPPGATYTVKAHIGATVAIDKTQEPIAHIISLRRHGPTQLRPVTVADAVVNDDQVYRAQAGLLAAGTSTKTEAQIFANMARDKVPAYVAKNSMNQAKRLVSFLFEDPEVDQPPQLSTNRSILAFICLPFAWGMSKAATSITNAVLQNMNTQAAVTAVRLSNIVNLWSWLPLVLLFPTLAAVVTLVMGVVGLVV
jgi:hypothetical protein